MNLNRVQILKYGKVSGPVIYWMSRDQRVEDNWAFLYAQKMAKQTKSSLRVVFCLTYPYLGASFRQYSFMLKGLQEVEKRLKALYIPFFLLVGKVEKQIPDFLKKQKSHFYLRSSFTTNSYS